MTAISWAPWNIQGSLIVLKPWPFGMAWQEVNLSTTFIWVQLHGIPLYYSNPTTIRSMRARIGPILDCDFPENRLIVCMNYPRLEVEINICNPLIPSCSLQRKNLPRVVITFRFESLSNFYTKCGRLNHNRNACSNSLPDCPPNGTFGPSLRADVSGVC